MASYFRNFNPVPRFPEYTGPYKVGTIDVEIPVSELDSPSPRPATDVETVLFRVWYPCEATPETSKPIPWLPNPQREHISAYSRFLGAGSRAAEIISFFPRILHYISIPVRKNAPPLSSIASSGRWPVMIFDHGLGGNRNTYSHLVGSVASHGVIVITPEHRDGSAPISHVRDPASTGGKDKSKKKVDYYRIAHKPSAEVHASRTAQLKIRLWEMGCIYDALHKIDTGVKLTNLNTSSKTLLPILSRKLAIHEPGTVTFAGHSFGATTTSQLLKSTFYGPTLSGNAPKDYEPLFTPSRESLLAQQITPNTPIILLDLWCLPLRAHSSRALWNLPFPAYAADGPGGAGILAIESQAFINWLPHLKVTKQFLSPDPSSPEPPADPLGRPPVRFYFPANSAHLSQSDFGILFPWATKKIFGSDEPERLLKLNTRAVLQMMRERGIPISGLSKDDLDDEETMTLSKGAKEIPAIITSGDPDIFAEGEQIRGWKFISLDLGDLKDVKIDDEDNEKGDEVGGKDVLGAVVEGEVMSSDDDSVAEAKALGGEIETKERNGWKEGTKL